MKNLAAPFVDAWGQVNCTEVGIALLALLALGALVWLLRRWLLHTPPALEAAAPVQARPEASRASGEALHTTLGLGDTGAVRETGDGFGAELGSDPQGADAGTSEAGAVDSGGGGWDSGGGGWDSGGSWS